jgi:hypothetical protein
MPGTLHFVLDLASNPATLKAHTQWSEVSTCNMIASCSSKNPLRSHSLCGEDGDPYTVLTHDWATNTTTRSPVLTMSIFEEPSYMWCDEKMDRVIVITRPNNGSTPIYFNEADLATGKFTRCMTYAPDVTDLDITYKLSLRCTLDSCIMMATLKVLLTPKQVQPRQLRLSLAGAPSSCGPNSPCSWTQ